MLPVGFASGGAAGSGAISVSPPKSVAIPGASTDVLVTVKRSSEGGLLFYMGEKDEVSECCGVCEWWM